MNRVPVACVALRKHGFRVDIETGEPSLKERKEIIMLGLGFFESLKASGSWVLGSQGMVSL